MTAKISIVLPVLNEAEQLVDKLQALQSLRSDCELIVADGGSTDVSRELAASLADKVLSAPRGRARQMNAGAGEAHGGILLFLHADTLLPAGALPAIADAVAEGYVWGRFDVRFDSKRPVFKLIAGMMNRRSRWTGIATGDQALFMTRAAFDAVGGFPEIALMEDIAVSKQLKKLGQPACLRVKVTTSARRWLQHGVVQTILLMWRLRLAYFFGADPNDLAARYYRRR